MIRDGHISFEQIVLLIWIPIGSTMFLATTRILVERAANSAWLCVFAAAIITSGILYIMTKLLERFPDETLIEIGEKVFGTVIGKLMGLAFAVLFFFLTAIRLREFGETIASVILPKTPISVIIFTYSTLMVYAATSGVEGIARSARFLLPFILLPAIVIIVMASPLLEMRRLLPVIDAPIGRIAITSGYTVSIFSEILILGILAPYIRKRKDIFSAGIAGIGLASVLIAMVIVYAIAIFTLIPATRLQFPTYTIASMITYGEFIQRIESLFVFMWFFSGALTLSILFYTCCLSVAQILKLNTYRPLIWPIGLLVYSISFLPSNVIQAFTFDFSRNISLTNVAIMLLPVATYGMARLTKKGGPSNAKSKND